MIVKTIKHESRNGGGRQLTGYLCNEDKPEEQARLLCASGPVDNPDNMAKLLATQEIYKNNKKNGDLFHIVLRSDYDDLKAEDWEKIAKRSLELFAKFAANQKPKGQEDNPKSNADSFIYVATLHEQQTDTNPNAKYHCHIALARNTRDGNYLSDLGIISKSKLIARILEKEFNLKPISDPNNLPESKANQELIKKGKAPRMDNFTHIQTVAGALLDSYKSSRQNVHYDQFKADLAAHDIQIKKSSGGFVFSCQKYPNNKTKRNKGEGGNFKGSSLGERFKLKELQKILDFTGVNNDYNHDPKPSPEPARAQRTNKKRVPEPERTSTATNKNPANKHRDAKPAQPKRASDERSSSRSGAFETGKTAIDKSKESINKAIRHSKAVQPAKNALVSNSKKSDLLLARAALEKNPDDARELRNKAAAAKKMEQSEKKEAKTKAQSNHQAQQATKTPANASSKQGKAIPPAIAAQPLGRAFKQAPTMQGIPQLYIAKDQSPAELARAAASKAAQMQAVAAYWRELNDYWYEKHKHDEQQTAGPSSGPRMAPRPR